MQVSTGREGPRHRPLGGHCWTALALSLPQGETRDLILAATFAAVLFSVLVQRATLGRLIEKLKDDQAPAVEEDSAQSAPVPPPA